MGKGRSRRNRYYKSYKYVAWGGGGKWSGGEGMGRSRRNRYYKSYKYVAWGGEEWERVGGKGEGR